MDWQTLLVHDGQTIVIATGSAIGITAVVAYRIKSRWANAEIKRQRELRKRLITEGWTDDDWT